jgi:hypothetical protein
MKAVMSERRANVNVMAMFPWVVVNGEATAPLSHQHRWNALYSMTAQNILSSAIASSVWLFIFKVL